MFDKKLAFIGIVAVVAVAIAVVCCFHWVNNGQDEVTDGVNYYGNGGTNSDGKSVVGMTDHIVMENCFSYGGAHFDSWNTESDGSGTTYHPGDYIKYADGTSVKLYAIWDTTGTYLNYWAIGTGEFVVSYDGEELPYAKEIKFPSSGVITLNLSYKTSDGRLVATDDSEIEHRIITGNEVRYKGIDFSLTGDAKCKMEADGSTNTGTFTITRTGTGDVDVTVSSGYEYNVVGVGVIYKSNNDDDKSETIDEGTVADNMFEDTGKEFVSWNTKEDGSGIEYKPGDSIFYYGYVVLYAQWR